MSNTELHYGSEKIVIKEQSPEEVLKLLVDDDKDVLVELDGTHGAVWVIKGAHFPIWAKTISSGGHVYVS